MAKSKLTDDVQEKIVGLLEAGNHDQAAFVAAGISKQTFYNWLNRGEAEKVRVAADARRSVKVAEKPYVDFFDTVTRARGAAEAAAVEAISKAGGKDWRAYAWLLERRYSQRWANTQRLQVQLEQEFSAMLGVLEEGLEPDEFRRVAGILAGGSSEA